MLRVTIRFASRVLGLLLILSGISGVASAGVVVPEIDPASAASAIALLSGVALMARDKFRS